MTRRATRLAVTIMAIALPALAARADGAGAADARAMLDRVVAAVKADRPAALVAMVEGRDGFRSGDLYPFCARARSGVVVAHPTLLGVNLAEQADKNGKLFGKEMLNTAREGTISDLHYMWPKPGHKTPVQKDTYYTKVDGLVCGVGFYN